ncbi:MAG: NAD(P)/FAD-dependent oxidoreductase [Vallitaleaceae bacterium]|jgi:glycerol-3-phosphate dehydrogenase|nr:NAD(P)/FAD-dependent oxidoreductase [Vallitaleaceae bacterium]
MYDIIIIGAGIIGTSIARALSRYETNILVIEKNYDIASETTMANSAIIHSGYDPVPGTKKALYNVKGSSVYEEICEQLDVYYSKVGSLTVAVTDEDMKTLQMLKDRGDTNGVPVILKTRDEVLVMEPNLSSDIKGALYAPTTAIVYPMEVAIAMMENAMVNGADLKVNEPVTSISQENQRFIVNTTKSSYRSKVVINAAGIFADQIHNMIAKPTFSIKPKRGQYYVLDQSEKGFVEHVIYPCPSVKGKGVLLVPTTHGNILIGPTSELIDADDSKEVTREGLSYIREKAEQISKEIPFNKVIHTFSGLRPTADTHDFIIEEVKDVPGFIDVAGIESPGLASAPAIAAAVVDIVNTYMTLTENPEFNPIRKGYRHFELLSDEEKRDLIKEMPAYGQMVCRCEHITEGEIIDCIRRPAGAVTVKGVKIRVRPGMGRCQGSFCEPQIVELLAEELGISPLDVLYDLDGSNILEEETKVAHGEGSNE